MTAPKLARSSPSGARSSNGAGEAIAAMGSPFSLAVGLMELLGNLTAGLPASHHEDASRRQRRWAAITLDIDGEYIAGHGGSARRTMRALVGAGADDDGARLNLTCRRLEHEARIIASGQRSDLYALPNGCPESVGIALEIGDDFIFGHEAVGIIAVVGMPGQLHRPVRGDQAEALPPVAPGLSDPSLLENDVLDAELGQLVADRQARLAGADHNQPDGLAHRGQC